MIFKTEDEATRKELEEMEQANPDEAREFAKVLGIEVIEDVTASVPAADVVIEMKGPSRKTITNMARRSRVAYKDKPKPAPAKAASPFAILTELKEYKRVMKLRFEAQSKTLSGLEKVKDEEVAKRAKALSFLMAKSGEPVEPMIIRNLERSAFLKK